VVQANVAMDVSSVARIEAKSKNGQWTAYNKLDQGKGYRLVDSCTSPVESCRTLSAGERIVLVPWSGFTCSAQCTSECDNDDFHPGTHRLVVTACKNPSKRFVGPTFEMPAFRKTLVRWRLAANIQRATIFRVEQNTFEEKEDGRPPEYVVRQKVLKETIRPLRAELIAEFASWLRSKPDPFWDNVMKRCVDQKRIVGLHLVTEAHGVRQDIEIVVDTACNSMNVVATEGRGRIPTQLHFDPSRSEVLSILRRGLPDDTELKSLQ
jgi:hypothetical protein